MEDPIERLEQRVKELEILFGTGNKREVTPFSTNTLLHRVETLEFELQKLDAENKIIGNFFRLCRN
jgi:hypothetical protein